MSDLSSNQKVTHTAGPWLHTMRNVAIADTGDYDGVDEVKAPGGRVVVTIWNGSEEDEANARLIAAAPDMLEALQAAWNCIGELPPTQARVEVAQLIRAAIQKATDNE